MLSIGLSPDIEVGEIGEDCWTSYSSGLKILACWMGNPAKKGCFLVVPVSSQCSHYPCPDRSSSASLGWAHLPSHWSGRGRWPRKPSRASVPPSWPKAFAASSGLGSTVLTRPLQLPCGRWVCRKGDTTGSSREEPHLLWSALSTALCIIV